MDTSIDNLIKSISDSVKKKNEEIKNLETDLEIYENKIEELEKVNKELQEINIKYFKQLKELTKSDDERIKNAYKDGYGTSVTKMSACLQEIKSDSVVTVEQGPTTLKVEQKSYEDEFEKALDENPGRCYFCVNNDDLFTRMSPIVLALSKTCEASPTSVARYLDKSVKNRERTGYTTILSNVSEDICRTLVNHLKGKGIGYSWDFV